MKFSRVFFPLMILMTESIVQAKEPWELDFPSLEDQMKAAQQEKFDAVLRDFQTNDYFAGTYSRLVDFNGREHIIDRRGEAFKRTPGNPPPRLDAIGALLGSVSADARGKIHIEVHETFNPDGSLASRDWIIDVGGQWQAQTGMDEAMGKQHK